MTRAAPHYMHVYERPREAGFSGVYGASPTVPLLGDWYGTWRVFEYRHRLIAKGLYDSASCAVRMRADEAEQFFANALGRTVHFVVDNPTQPIFEGFIERITYRVGGATLTRSLTEMANDVVVTYYNADSGAAVKTEITASVQNSASIAIYGQKTLNFDAGIHYNNADKTHKTTLRNTLLALRAWPQVSVSSSASFDDGIIEVEVRGLMYMLDWSIYTQTAATGLNNPDALIQRVIVRSDEAAVAANSRYIIEMGTGSGSLAARDIAANSSYSMSRVAQSGQTHLQFFESIVEAGDGTDRYVWGIEAFGVFGPTRTLYYRRADKTIKYQAFVLRDAGRLRDVYGSFVDGWRVRPDGAVVLMDVLAGWTQSGDDPRVGYIQAIEYDADANTVQWQTSDNLTMEGVLQKNRYFRAHGGDRFGAPVRNVL